MRKIVLCLVFATVCGFVVDDVQAGGKITRGDLAAPGRGGSSGNGIVKPFRKMSSASKRININMEGKLPKFDHEILIGINQAYPNGFASPMEAWETLGLYAQQGDAFWLVAICLSPIDSRWRFLPLGKSDEKGQMRTSLHNLFEIANNLENRITLVRTMAFMFNADDIKDARINILLGKVPAPFCPPNFHDILNQMKFLLASDCNQEKNIRQMETGYYLTPAGIFSVNISRNSKIYKTLCKKKCRKLEDAVEDMYDVPDSMLPFVSKVRQLSIHELGGWYSEKAWKQFLAGDDVRLKKEYADKKAYLEQYVKLLKKYGIQLNFVAFHSQEKFLTQW